jgi:hypothetical protein
MSSKHETKSTTTATNAYNPTSLNSYNALQGPILANLRADMNPDVTQNPLFNLQLGQTLGATGQLNSKLMSNILARIQQSGFGEGSPFAQSQICTKSNRSWNACSFA